MPLPPGQKNLTRGNLTWNLLSFALPFLLANLLQALYGAVDLWVIGQFGGGKIGVAAVSNGSEVMFLTMAFIMGLTTGATVMIGRFFGAGDRRNTNRSVGMALSFALLLGAALTLLMVAITPLIADMMRTPKEALSQTIDYMTCCAWGILFITMYNVLSAIFRGFGNSIAPLVFVGLACFINVIGDLLFVSCWQMGPKGAALATVISQAISMAMALLYLKYGNFGFKFLLPNFRIRWELVWDFLKIGVPIGIQGILINLSFLFIISVVNAMGGESAAPAAGYGIVNRLNGFAMLPAISFSMALSAITAQNIGAGKPVRAIKTLWLALLYTLAAGLVFLLLMQTIPEQLITLFIDRQTDGAAEVVLNGSWYAKSFSWEYILVPVVFCTNGFFNGCGRTFFSMSNNLAGTFLIRVPVSYLVSKMPEATLFHVGLAAPLASFCSGVVAVLYLLSGKWRNARFRTPKD